ncbi:uncharacterized protein ColSpa_10992 [Colletotrichum spaethianum]|uniref:Uncharacterized protein n=1 Tax=Colletotrichum spaethianum TaxID=700344 RepID=A0AA37PEH1_9PEZI|nr:uncharacterized protein ColSpa_10992 [Colletotrichum spaethianum]GKT50811.1 hypothetical protein ColSpa_10992 [Colletotrichum spaethianum]
MASCGLYYSPTATVQRAHTPTITNGFRLVNGLRVPARLRNHRQSQQSTGQPGFFTDDSKLFHSPTVELQRNTIDSSYRLVNDYRVPKPIRRRNTTPLSFTEEIAFFHSPPAAKALDGASMNALDSRIDNLGVPACLGDNEHQFTYGRLESFSSAISEPQFRSQSWLSSDQPIINSPTAAFPQVPRDNILSRTHNGLRIPHPISHSRRTTNSITRHNGTEKKVQDTESCGILQETPLNITGRAINYRRLHSYQTARAAHILHTDPNNVEEDEVTAEARQAQFCTLVDIAIDRLHDPFTNEDRQVLRQIVGYLDQRRYDLVARRISVDSNAPQVTVPATWTEVADLAFEAIRTVDYPYLLRVMQAIDILSSGIWYFDSEETETKKENIPLGFNLMTG